ncbi:MAG: alpha/beta hydrolase [Acidobacteriota bacterium]
MRLVRRLPPLALVVGILILSACAPAQRALVRTVFAPAEPLPASRELHDLPYTGGEDAIDKHRLDLFLPSPETPVGWPTVVFVHGGGWTEGDRNLTVAGYEIYGNLGRRLAERGVGAAVISYRLQPAVGWREQVDDVAQSVAWVHTSIAAHGGDAGRLFLSGHSAGAQLVTYVSLAPWPLAAAGLEPTTICGVAPISGVGFALADEATYAAGADRSYYRRRFGGTEGWQGEASAITYLESAAPPFLIVYGDAEWASLQRQNALLDAMLRQVGVASRLLVLPNVSHRLIIAQASDPGEPILPALVDFVRTTECAPHGALGAAAAKRGGD